MNEYKDEKMKEGLAALKSLHANFYNDWMEELEFGRVLRVLKRFIYQKVIPPFGDGSVLKY